MEDLGGGAAVAAANYGLAKAGAPQGGSGSPRSTARRKSRPPQVLPKAAGGIGSQQQSGQPSGGSACRSVHVPCAVCVRAQCKQAVDVCVALPGRMNMGKQQVELHGGPGMICIIPTCTHQKKTCMQAHVAPQRSSVPRRAPPDAEPSAKGKPDKAGLQADRQPQRCEDVQVRVAGRSAATAA